MNTESKPSFLILLLLISFPAVNAVLYTPALPSLTYYFKVSSDAAQQTITIFLLGYTLGQLIYGPIANRYGRLPAIYVGAIIQVISSLVCVLAAHWQSFELFYAARFVSALGSGVGLKMTFTLVNEYYADKIAAQKISSLILAFAVAPGLAVSIGGVLTEYVGWVSCFYFLAAYGVLILVCATRLPETKTTLDLDAFKYDHLVQGYVSQFKNPMVIAAGLLMGSGCALIYLFATLSPFIAITQHGLSSAAYGFINFLPSLGLLLGALTSTRLLKSKSITQVVTIGVPVAFAGVISLSLGMLFNFSVLWSLFIPGMVVFAGNALIYGNASTLGLQATEDKSHGSAVMNFINMGMGTLAVFSLSLHEFNPSFVLPFMCLMACIISAVTLKWIKSASAQVPE